MSDHDHIQLAEVLRRIRGRAVLSGYRTELYDNLYADWNRVDAKVRNCHSVRKPRQESVWTNFQAMDNAAARKWLNAERGSISCSASNRIFAHGRHTVKLSYRSMFIEDFTYGTSISKHKSGRR